MNYTLQISNQFYIDFDDTYNYIKDVLKNPDAAESLKEKTKESILKLKSFPNTGSILYNYNRERSIFRYIRVDNYFIFYRIDNFIIYIHKMIYQGRDYMKIIFPNEKK